MKTKMKPTPKKKKPAASPAKGQPKITSFFVKVDSPSAGSSSGGLVLGGVRKPSRAKIGGRLISRKVIPESQVVCISDDDDEVRDSNADKADDVNDADIDIAGPSQIKARYPQPRHHNTRANSTAETQKMEAEAISSSEDDEEETQVTTDHTESSRGVLQSAEEETQVNEDEEETQVDDNSDHRRSSSPSLLTNILVPLSGQDHKTRLTKYEHDHSDSELDDLVLAEDTDLDDLVSKEVDRVLAEDPQPARSPSPKRGLIYLTPIKNLLSPTKSGLRSPTRTVKSKALYFSPVRHVHKSSLDKSVVSSSPAKSVPSTSSPNKSEPSTSSPSKPKTPPYSTPYYLDNFLEIVNAVTSDQHHAHLLNEPDLAMLTSFNKLSLPAKCLYIRLFQRKWTWRAASGVKYEKIAEDLSESFGVLHSGGFLDKLKELDDGEDNLDLKSLLQLLNGEQMTLLVKDMSVKVAGSKTKENSIEVLLNLARNQRTLRGSSSEIIYKAACRLLGPTYKVSAESKSLFSRMFILYAPPMYWEEEAESNQLLTSLLTKVGRMEYAEYGILRKVKIYPDREDLIRFHSGWRLHSELQSHLESKDFKSAQSICDESLQTLKSIIQTPQILHHDSTLPTFLRAFTAGSILTRTIYLSLDAYQKSKDYAKANEILDFLLTQSVYCTHYRGRWFERMLINLKHLKADEKEMRRMILNGLADEFLMESHKLGLTQRFEKVSELRKRKSNGRKAKRPRKDDSSDEEDGTSVHLVYLRREVPSRTIEGEKMDMGEGRAGKSVFIGSNSTSSKVGNSASSVEAFAMEFYRKMGYTLGVHGEGSVPIAIFGLFFWNIIYHDQIPDVFQSPHQPYPLDIHFEDFYSSRRELIERQLVNLRHCWSMEDALKVLEENYAHVGKISVVNWAVFQEVEDVKSLVKSMGLPLVASICARLASNFRHFRSGFPDLILWNSSKCIFVEVKGPGDSLSAKQSLWLDFLVSVGAEAEICYVKSVSNKRIPIES